MTAEEIRDACLQWLDEHRSVCDEERCVEPLGLIAFLCHCLGLSSDQTGKLRFVLAQYEAQCKGCQHLKDTN